MGYTKTAWTVEMEITSTLLNKLETQYTAAKYDVDNHDHDDTHYTKTEMDAAFFHGGNDGAGSGCDADTLEGHEAMYFAGVGVPSGLILMFSGATPSGWYDCDGNNGTPDLRDRFVVGAGSSYSVGNAGGSASVTPTATVTVAAHSLTVDEIPTHNHGYTDKYRDGIKVHYNEAAASGSVATGPSDHSRNTGTTGAGDAHGHPGSTFDGESQNNLPPYYALKFIMKS